MCSVVAIVIAHVCLFVCVCVCVCTRAYTCVCTLKWGTILRVLLFVVNIWYYENYIIELIFGFTMLISYSMAYSTLLCTYVPINPHIVRTPFLYSMYIQMYHSSSVYWFSAQVCYWVTIMTWTHNCTALMELCDDIRMPCKCSLICTYKEVS